MKQLQALSQLKPLQCIRPLKKEPPKRLETPLSEIELIMYSTNICYHGMNILRGETIVKNREAKLQALNREILKICSLLQMDNYYFHSTYTKENTKKFFNDVGIRAEHLKY
ncbi:MAG: hypothetical protein OEL19_06790 [Sulfurimonas sp.]|nr:hypothetical protein [Sulfurimonas sp.]